MGKKPRILWEEISSISYSPLCRRKLYWAFLIHATTLEFHRGKEFHQLLVQWKPILAICSSVVKAKLNLQITECVVLSESPGHSAANDFVMKKSGTSLLPHGSQNRYKTKYLYLARWRNKDIWQMCTLKQRFTCLCDLWNSFPLWNSSALIGFRTFHKPPSIQSENWKNFSCMYKTTL